MTPEQKALAELIKKAMTDPGFKARLKADPNATLAQVGLPVPAKTTVHVVEDSADTVWIRIPYKPSGTLSIEELEAVVGGFHNADFSGQWGRPA